MQFTVDSRIHASCVWLGDWSLSGVYLKNEANFPWLILVPRVANVREIYQLSELNRYTLMDEVVRLSAVMQDFFKPDKLNVGALGNIVSQLHVHIVARFQTDKLWPDGIWQPNSTTVPYSSERLADLMFELGKKI